MESLRRGKERKEPGCRSGRGAEKAGLVSTAPRNDLPGTNREKARSSTVPPVLPVSGGGRNLPNPTRPPSPPGPPCQRSAPGSRRPPSGRARPAGRGGPSRGRPCSSGSTSSQKLPSARLLPSKVTGSGRPRPLRKALRVLRRLALGHYTPSPSFLRLLCMGLLRSYAGLSPKSFPPRSPNADSLHETLRKEEPFEPRIDPGLRSKNSGSSGASAECDPRPSPQKTLGPSFLSGHGAGEAPRARFSFRPSLAETSEIPSRPQPPSGPSLPPEDRGHREPSSLIVRNPDPRGPDPGARTPDRRPGAYPPSGILPCFSRS